MMTATRYEAEFQALATHFPSSRFGFVWDSKPRLEVILPISMFNAVYMVKIYGLDKFPETQPIVTPGKILVDCNGAKMTQPSRANHLLGTFNRETRLCIYSEWEPRYSLTKTALRAATWLHAYHCHLQTGRSLDSYLSHAN